MTTILLTNITQMRLSSLVNTITTLSSYVGGFITSDEARETYEHFKEEVWKISYCLLSYDHVECADSLVYDTKSPLYNPMDIYRHVILPAYERKEVYKTYKHPGTDDIKNIKEDILYNGHIKDTTIRIQLHKELEVDITIYHDKTPYNFNKAGDAILPVYGLTSELYSLVFQKHIEKLFPNGEVYAVVTSEPGFVEGREATKVFLAFTDTYKLKLDLYDPENPGLYVTTEEGAQQKMADAICKIIENSTTVERVINTFYLPRW